MTKMPKKQKGKPTKKKNLPKKSKPPKLDIIERYCNLISGGGGFKGFTDAQRDYQEAIALFNISTLIGRKALIFSLPGIKFVKTDGTPEGGSEPLNLWFILIGKSRVARKTVSVSKSFDLIEHLSKDSLLPDDFTPQSLVQILSKRKKGEVCVWLNDEISAFFKMLNNKRGYMLTADVVLSRVYDGRKYSRSTISRGREEIEAPYLTTMLASTEYLPTLFDRGSFKQGFLNRFVYVVLKPGDPRGKRTRATQKETDELNSIVEWFEALLNFKPPGNYNSYSIAFASDAKKLLDKFDRSVGDKIREGVNSHMEGWLGNQPDLAERLAAIYRIAKFTEEELEAGSSDVFIIIEKEDVKKALRYLKKTRKWFKRVLVLMGQPGEAPAPKTVEKNLPYVLSKIKECGRISKKTGNYYCTRGELTKATRIAKRDLDEIISLARDDGRIQIRIKRKKMGRPITIYELLPKRKKE